MANDRPRDQTPTGTVLSQAQKDALRALGIADDEIPLFSPEEADRAIQYLTPELVQKARNGGGTPPEDELARGDQKRSESSSEAPAPTGAPWDESFAPADTPEPVCVHCKLNPPDGTERAFDDGMWIHPRCEDAYITAGMAEESLSQKNASSPQTPQQAHEIL